MSGKQSSRGNPSLGDMLRSIVVLGAIVLALFVIGLLFTSEPDEPVKPVDYATAATNVRKTVDYPVLAPDKLPKGWRATSARYTPGNSHAWHLGVLTSDDEYLGLEQATVSKTRLVEKFADRSKPAGSTTIAGDTWHVRRYGGDRVVLRETDDVTTLVIGSVGQQKLENYVSSLSSDSGD